MKLFSKFALSLEYNYLYLQCRNKQTKIKSYENYKTNYQHRSNDY